MTLRKWKLSARISAALKQAVEENRLDVAEHLLCALEVLDAEVARPSDGNRHLRPIPAGRLQH